MANTLGWLRRVRANLANRRDGLPARRSIDRRPRFESLETRCVLNYSITNVGALSTFGADPVVNGLNNRGAVIGTSPIAAQENIYPYMNYFRGFVYTHGTIASVGTLGGNSLAEGINDRGTIVGTTVLFPNNLSSSQTVVFIRQRGRMSPLVTLNTKQPLGQISINNRGEVTGFPASNGNDLLLKNGKRSNIGSLGGHGSLAACPEQFR